MLLGMPPAGPPQPPAQQAEDKRTPVRATVTDDKPNGVRVMPGSSDN